MKQAEEIKAASQGHTGHTASMEWCWHLNTSSLAFLHSMACPFFETRSKGLLQQIGFLREHREFMFLHWRIDAFELWCCRRLLRVPWTARRSNQSILKEISPGCSLKDWCWSWNSGTLATWCEKLTQLKRPWCWERLGAGGEGDDRGWDGWTASLTQWTWVWVNSGSWWWTGRPGVLWFTGSQGVGDDWVTELNWTH